MNRISLLLLSFISVFQLRAQSLSGNMNSAETNISLGFGNVDIYREGKLVASVLTDRAGNFNVALDTGTYKCVVNYAGFKPVEKTIRVDKDVKADFSVKKDETKLAAAERAERMNSDFATKAGVGSTALLNSSTGLMGGEVVDGVTVIEHIPTKRMIPYEFTASYKEDASVLRKKVSSIGSGALTAGEINDFAKWKLWQDITANQLQSFQTSWNVAPKGRYTLNLTSQSGLPIADARVKLLLDRKKILFCARTDNTGKAELWLTLLNETPDINGRLTMEIAYNGQSVSLNDVKTFEVSVNHMVMDIRCDQSENVDVAFVVDATGSMGDELSFLKAEMNDIIFKSKQISSKLNFRFANVFYRDRGTSEQYLTKVMPFNRVLSESVNFIDQQSAGGGGDYEEAVEVALDSAINNLEWSKQARARIVFLILDAPPHNTPEIQAKLRHLIEQAAEKGIRIVPIGASGINKSTEYIMRAMALGTNGTYTFLTSHSGIGGTHIEPTTDKYDVETLNQVIVRILKSYTYMPDCEQNIPDLALNYPDSVVAFPPPDVKDSSDTSLVIKQPEIPQSDSVRVRWNYYPNPTNGLVTVTADRDIEELYITDLSGKVLQIIANVNKERAIQIDLSNYATGIYLIRYPVGKTWISGKVILQRNS